MGCFMYFWDRKMVFLGGMGISSIRASIMGEYGTVKWINPFFMV